MSFDAEAFLNQQYKEATDTKTIKVPEGEYLAVTTDKIDYRIVPRRDGSGDLHILSINWEMQDDDGTIKKTTGRDRNIVSQDIILEMKGDTINMDKGQNAGLGQLRAALGQNKAGTPWSPRQLSNAGPALVVVRHRENPNDAENPYVNVTKVASPARA